MKLNSKYLKQLILEVLDEATRRDFLKGAAGIAGLAALGKGLSDLYDDEEEKDRFAGEDIEYILTRQDAIDAGLNPDEYFPPEGQEFDPDKQIPLENPEDAWKEKKSPYSKEEGKAALDYLRFTPEDLEYYGVAPAQGTGGEAYAMVDMGQVFDMADEDPRIAEALEVSAGFFNDWTLKQHYNYLFSNLALWGTYKDESNPNSTKMAPTIKAKDPWDRDIDVNMLPVAWSNSLDIWTNRMSSFQAKWQQYPNDRKKMLQEQQMTLQEYKQMAADYEDILVSLSGGATITNPNYQPPEEQ